MKTIVVGLGNPILGDDGAGWKVAEEIKLHLPADTRVDVNCLSLGGISLMEHLVGYDRAILIDTFKSNEARGSIHVMNLDDLPNYSAFHTTSAHDTSLQNAILMGRNMGAKLPGHIMIVGITAEPSFEFSEALTPEIQAAVPFAVRAALELLEKSELVGEPA
jgi:hydrogenase maturation protease